MDTNGNPSGRYISEVIRFPKGTSRDVPPGVTAHWIRLVPTPDGKDVEHELILMRYEVAPLTVLSQELTQ